MLYLFYNLSKGTTMSHKIHTPSWLENQIQKTMKQIELDPDDNDLVSLLDKYISMKKKYDKAIDPLGETIRVMEDFANYTKNNNLEHIELIKTIVTGFMNSK